MSGTQDFANQAAPRPQLEPEAWKRAGISRSQAYELMAAQPPGFPRPVKIGRASRFVSAEVDSWIDGRIEARDAAPRTAGASHV
jgi:predicted DNA-binding transcriptional regulator AlpA